MARAETTFSRVSTGYKDSNRTIAESGYDLSFIDGFCNTLTGTTFTGAVAGAVAATTLTASTSLAVGAAGTTIEKISLTTHSVDFGSVTSLAASSIKTVGITGAANGDFLVAMHPSLWSGTYEMLRITATSGDTTGEVNLYVTNSGITAIDSAAAVVNILHIDF